MSIPAAEYDLTDAELAILWPAARAQMFARAQTNPRPLAVVVGAQPGAGKTRTIARVRADHPDRRFAALDSDILRRAHPRFDEIMQRDPTRMPVLTNQAASALFRMGLAEAHAGGYDVIIENTLHNADDVLAEAQRFADDGYRVEVVALAVPEVDSRLAMVGRYFSALDQGDPARWTNNASHDRGYTGAPQTLAALQASPAVDRVVVTDRTGATHYDSQAPANTDPSAAAALQRIRATPKTTQEIDAWLTGLEAVRQLADTHGVRDAPSVDAVFQRLDDDAAFLTGERDTAPTWVADPPQTFRGRLQYIREQSRTRSRPERQPSAEQTADSRPDDDLGDFLHNDRPDRPSHGLRH